LFRTDIECVNAEDFVLITIGNEPRFRQFLTGDQIDRKIMLVDGDIIRLGDSMEQSLLDSLTCDILHMENTPLGVSPFLPQRDTPVSELGKVNPDVDHLADAFRS